MQDNAFNYDKGVLAEILEPIMGKGLIPADLETWKPRRRAIVPSFHKAYLEAMVQMFGRCTQNSLDKFDALLEGPGVSQLGRGQLCSVRNGSWTREFFASLCRSAVGGVVLCMWQNQGLGRVQWKPRRDSAGRHHCLGLSWLWLCC